MVKSNGTIPTKIVDKNGKVTTVHKKQDVAGGNKSNRTTSVAQPVSSGTATAASTEGSKDSDFEPFDDNLIIGAKWRRAIRRILREEGIEYYEDSAFINSSFDVRFESPEQLEAVQDFFDHVNWLKKRPEAQQIIKKRNRAVRVNALRRAFFMKPRPVAYEGMSEEEIMDELVRD